MLRLEESGELSEDERGSLLRALHTLKGNSGMLGLHPVVESVHAIEAAFRDPERRWSRTSIDTMFETAAALRRVAERIGTEGQDDAVARLSAIELPREDDVPASSPHAAEAASESPPKGDSEDEALPESPDDAELAGQALTGGELLRVPFKKLDVLLNRVGEMVTIGTALEELLDRFGPALDEIGALRLLETQVESLQLISSGLREATMDLRLVSIARLFQRFPSVARDLARAQGKKVRVVLEGEEEELDKSTVDALADPLLHLVRNAVDHGLGTPDERKAAGKPDVGTITLSARRLGDRVMVEVRDDGSGLDRGRILVRAREEGLVTPQEQLTGGEIDELIFRTGFSTRSTATTVSGRGVGLDVVQRRVRSLRGRLSVMEAEGGGTRFLLSLPLTLAIVPALIFEADGEMLALPATEVEQTLRRVRPERAGGAEVLRYHDDLIPVARPGPLLGWPPAADREHSGKSFAIVLRRGTRSAAVLADRLLEQRDVVVKALPRSLGPLRGVSGATVTPGGRVVLVLDPGGLLDLNLETHRRENRG